MMMVIDGGNLVHLAHFSFVFFYNLESILERGWDHGSEPSPVMKIFNVYGGHHTSPVCS